MAKTFGSRTTYQGKPVNEGTRQILIAANKMVRSSRFGSEKENITLIQGSYNRGGVAQSAGTHDGGGAFDITSYNQKNRIKIFRLLGTTAWYRPTLPGHWSAHIHGIVCGDGSVSSGGKYQVSEYYAGRNGLANKGKDRNWRPYKLPILFKLNGNLATHYVTKTTEFKDQPYSKGKTLARASKNQVFTPIAWVKNAYGNYWAINVNGYCMYGKNLTTKKPVIAKPKPKEPSTRVFTTRIATKNVIVKRMLDFKHRATLIANDLSDNVTILHTQEAGRVTDAEILKKALEKATNKPWSFHIWGDGFDISQATYFRTDIYSDEYTGYVKFSPASPGNSHNIGTLQKLKHKQTGIVFWTINAHLEYRGGSTYDKARQSQMTDLINQSLKFIKNDPFLIAGDLNSYLEKTHDGPGRVFKEKGLVDIELTPAIKINMLYDSFIGNGKTVRKNSRQIDRCAIKQGKISAKILEVKPRLDNQGKYRKPLDSDHLTVEFELYFTK